MTPSDKPGAPAGAPPREPPPEGYDDQTSPAGGVSLAVHLGVRTPAPEPPRERADARGADPFLGKVLDHRYRLLQLVAKGGMGRVYRAEQAPLGRIVAVKVLEASPEQDQEFRDRFTREAAACARLTHPNTIRIFDFGCTWDDIPYLAMEYLEGRNLHTTIRADAPMAPARVIHIATQICGSLREAHELGLVHRDLKPSNVMLISHGGEPEFVKVLDFGLVKELRGDSELTRADAVVGSPSYMSPEQIRATPVDSRSDIYALGILLYACLTGKTPFSGANTVNVLMAHLSNAPPPLRVANPRSGAGPLLEWVVMTCLAKEPEDRFATVDELRRALALAGAEAAGQAVPRVQLVHGVVVTDEAGPLTSPSLAVPRPDAVRAEAPRPDTARPESVDAGAPSPDPLPSSPSRSRRLPDEPSRVRRALPWGIAAAALLFGLIGMTVLMVWIATHPPAAFRPVAVPAPSAAVEALAAPASPPPETTPAAGTDPTAGTTAAAATPPTPTATTASGTSAAGTAAPPADDTPTSADPASGSRSGRTRAEPVVTRIPQPDVAPAPEPEPPPPPAEEPAAPRTSSDLRDPWKDR